MKLGGLMIAGALWLAGMATAALAQSPEEMRASIPALMRDAFDAPYGKALVAEFGKSLRAGADPVCLSAKGIGPDQLEQRGRDLIVKWGTRMMESVNGLVDRKVYDEKFAASAAAELTRLRNDTNVKRQLELERPIRLAKAADMAFEQFDRYVLISRIELSPVSPQARGNAELMAKNPTETAEEKLDKFQATNRSAALKRFLALSEPSVAARAAATSREAAMKSPPHTLFKGVEADLTELCILSKR